MQISQILRTMYIGGNWKSNNTLAQSQQLVEKVINNLQFDNNKLEVSIFPPIIHIPLIQSILKNTSVKIGSQNCSKFGFGAFTGEISAQHLSDMHIKSTLIGHSERRQILGETNQIISDKIVQALKQNLDVILCIGETLEQRENQKTLGVIEAQLSSVFDLVKEEKQWEKLIIAYEPVWAIGTGKVASSGQAQEVHQFIRKWVKDNVGKVNEKIRIIYGGSVTEKNCEELIKQKDIDGFLVGGASLKPEFKEIIRIVNEIIK